MQISKYVHALKIPFEIKTDTGTLERFVYSYLIAGDTLILIDSGVKNSEEIIFDYMEEIGLDPEDLTLLILTHSHPDHIGSASSIKRKTYCEVAAHSGEKEWIEDIELQFKERPVPNFHSLVDGPVDVDIVLEDGDEFELDGKLNLKITHTPGHSNGSISIFLREEKILFSGDSIPLKGGLPIYDDYRASLKSIEKLKDIEKLKWLLSSWDDPQQGDELYLIFEEAIDYLKTINDTVAQVSEFEEDANSLEFTKKVLKELGIPEMAANPIVERSFQANLRELGE
ncbi:MAG: MBL fold metallo-hydrolase [Methanobacteriaceae archaeon]|nr:MBL fold metallo-hydrolase [Methanobacteriaceae archaeon]MDP2835982.1 MBL fold metallo-hydrolase [Methanobacteriaceae archaeon]MDP3035756.1 MBL fold metallo-hydrolase [Methanobacteriaceae archaeon]MDP3484053.1 MBL fold metallo-hydrolase [Methanobacteriaceae archaeon]MDP3622806.1 MBL fold metallo-hydrolase [Methanobacteriaceae archaeon]